MKTIVGLITCIVAIGFIEAIPVEVERADDPRKDSFSAPETERTLAPPLSIIRVYPVTITIYHAVESQCDADPLITADGTRITDPATQRICALSRNLLSRWGGAFRYGDTVEITGTGKYDGVWYVHDTMNARFMDHVDLLVPTTVRGGKWQGTITSE